MRTAAPEFSVANADVRPGFHVVADARRRCAAIAALLLAVVGTLVGCQAPQVPVNPATAVFDVRDYDAFVDDTLSTLRRYDFAPEFVDRTRGYIRSNPATSAQWFEVWRVDARGGYQALESNLHTMRRRVTVRIIPVAATTQPTASPDTQPAVADTSVDVLAGPSFADHAVPGPYRVAVEVDKERYSAPDRQLLSTSSALNVYSARMPTTSGRFLRRGAGVTWIPAGRDPLLEEFLLRKLGRSAACTAP